MLWKIDLEVDKILDSFKIKDAPIPIESIIKGYNLHIGRAPSNEFSGLLIRKEEGALIGINSDEPMVRQRFTIAHELGHYLLHKEAYTFVDYRDNKKKIIRNKKEIEANAFAAALLMPKKYLLEDIKNNKFDKLEEIEEMIKLLAFKYKVSEEAMKFRFINVLSSKI